MKQIAIISGGSGGIGGALAARLAAEPGVEEIWLLGRDTARLAACAEGISCSCRLLVGPAPWTLLPDALRGRDVSVIWLVAAAGFGRFGDFATEENEVYAAMQRANMEYPTALLSAALPYMHKGSHIVTLSSAAAFVPEPHFAVYAATKAYVYHLSRALGVELRARGISVTAVCPGPVDTGFLDVAGTGRAGLSPVKRRALVSPERVADVALRDARRRRAVSVPTFRMKVARLAARLLPHHLTMRFFS